jgi:hypothetical protein
MLAGGHIWRELGLEATLDRSPGADVVMRRR